MEEKHEFPFERDARRGDVPSGLSLLSAGACYWLARIYAEYRADGNVNKARLAKNQLWQRWTAEQGYLNRIVRLWKETELAASACRKDPTPENAIALCNAIVGLSGKGC